MSWYDDKDDFWHLLGDPGGYISGQNKEGFGGIKKGIFGDPDSIKDAYDKMIQMSQTGSKDIQNFLMGQQGKALSYFSPIQHMFNSAYGTEGLQSPQVPQGIQGSTPLQRMYGGK